MTPTWVAAMVRPLLDEAAADVDGLNRNHGRVDAPPDSGSGQTPSLNRVDAAEDLLLGIGA